MRYWGKTKHQRLTLGHGWNYSERQEEQLLACVRGKGIEKQNQGMGNRRKGPKVMAEGSSLCDVIFPQDPHSSLESY